MKWIIHLIFISLGVIICFHTGAHAGEASIRVYSTVQGRAQVFLRPSGEGRYLEVAHEIPAVIPVQNNGNYEVLIVKYENFFFRSIGEKKDVHSPEIITITTRREILWARVLIVAFIPLLGALEYSRRMRTRKSLELAGSLKEAENRVEEAELRAERSAVETRMPEKIGDYHILQKIGEGGMATVYKAEDSSGDMYALKVPHPGYLENSEFMKRFAHEARIGQNLNNPYIARIYDYNMNAEKGVPFICMEFLEGETLGAIRKRAEVMEISAAIKYVREIAQGLHYAHSKNVIHRDIKPGNIVITPQDRVKIMDFGVAKAADLSELTVTDTALGTPKYMAPEQIDSKSADARADLYALGIIFYELITGRVPYEDQDPYKIVMKKLSAPPPPPGQFNHSIPPHIERCILRLIARDPRGRYQSASELLAELDGVGILSSEGAQKKDET